MTEDLLWEKKGLLNEGKMSLLSAMFPRENLTGAGGLGVKCTLGYLWNMARQAKNGICSISPSILY